MRGLVSLFVQHCEDRETLEQLGRTIQDRGSWTKAHGAFGNIRAKTLKAERRSDRKLEAQYLFEEACAKTLYNLTHPQGPFDPDSPYWIIPNALSLAAELGIDPIEVIKLVGNKSGGFD
ncbi:hypothetical protein ACSBOB_17320 [Mesorhizobium sp. ASY16-5R]|uniref:hypothetical protein n=1 Tax=Mesorhizobium sp. ASY16-5R TaxID=3445772 RepID=UPI003FA06935